MRSGPIPLIAAAVATALVAAAGCDDRTRAPLAQGPVAGIPDRPVTRTVRVQAAYDANRIYLRIRFPAQEGTLQEYFHRDAGAWVREGGGFRDLAAALAGDEERGDTARVSAHSETVLSMFVSDRGSPFHVRDFDKYGCVLACHERQRQMPNWRFSDGPSPMTLWPGFGGFADTWTWRSHRTQFAGFADDGSISSAGFLPDAGAVPFTNLSLPAGGLPPFVFSSAQNGGSPTTAWSGVLAGTGPFAFDNGSFAAFPDAVANTAGIDAADGEAVPAQIVSLPGGSRADVKADATFSSGEWDLRLTRSLTTADASHDVFFAAGGIYDVALSLHSDDADGRDHYISLPFPIVLGTTTSGLAATLIATSSGAPAFDDATFPVRAVEAFLPGVTSFEFVVGATTTRDGAPRTDDVTHGGANEVAQSQHSCADCHTVHSTDPKPPVRDAGPFESLVLRRGGVFTGTPFFQEAP